MERSAMAPRVFFELANCKFHQKRVQFTSAKSQYLCRNPDPGVLVVAWFVNSVCKSLDDTTGGGYTLMLRAKSLAGVRLA
jgi:hypothetical protein